MIAYLGSKHFTDRDSILAHMDSVTRGVKLVAVDVETISLVNLTPVGVGFAPNAEDAFYFTTYPELDSDFPWEIIQSPDIRKIHHNALFDLSSIDEFEPDANVDDTTLMAHLLNLPADLVTLSSIFLPGTEVHGMEEYLGKGQTTQDLDPGLLARKCCQDCLATYRLYHELHPLVDSSYYEVERQLIPILVEMSLKGLKIDHMERERLGQKLESDMGYYRSICDEYDFNPGSHQQVGHILAKRGNILPFRRRRDREGKWKMKLVTVEEELEKLSDPLAAAIINYRHAQKALSTYIKPYAGKVRAFTRWHMDAVTGRITSTRRNMQNIPPELRSMFVPDNGVFTDWDASQLELRVLAYISGDRAMIEIYETGGDIHQHTADFMGIDRRPAKNVNFCVPTSVEALTPDGWKPYYELRYGDRVLGYNQELEVCLWTQVISVMQPVASDVITFGNNHVQFRSTAGHRWYGRRRIHTHNHGDRYTNEVRTLDRINSEFTIRLSAPAWFDIPDSMFHAEAIPVSPVEASIIAWIYTDGSVDRFQIHQSKYIAVIRDLLIGIPHTEYKSRQDGLVTFELRKDYGRSLWLKTQLTNRTLEQFVLGLSDSARKSFLYTAIMAEGCEQFGTVHITQNFGAVLNAIKLAAFLEGYFVRSNGPYPSAAYPGNTNVRMSLSSPYLTGQRLKVHDVSVEDVWCMQTGQGSWVAKDIEGKIFITGNAMIYGATDQTIAETAHITSVRRAHELKEKWFDAYPDAGLWIMEQQRMGVTEGYVETLYGRRIKVDAEDEQGAMRKAVNYPIQGSAAEIIKRAMIKCRELPLVLQVHDELIADGDVTQQVLEAGLEKLSPVYTPYDIKTVRRWE